jgi:predicted enzyme related to lactoylglutathione lyase
MPSRMSDLFTTGMRRRSHMAKLRFTLLSRGADAARAQTGESAMNTLRISAVLFAGQLARVAAFYQGVFAVKPERSDAAHVSLIFGEFELVIHQIPKHLLSSASDDSPAGRRERTAIRLDIPVPDIMQARREAKRLGGVIDDLSPPWAGGDSSFFLGHDPEGNVFGAKLKAS